MDRGPVDTVFTPVAGGSLSNVLDLVPSGDTLLIFHDAGIFGLMSGGSFSIPQGALPEAPRTGIDYNGQLWVGSGERGIYVREGSGFVEFAFTGPPSNDVSTMVTAQFHVD